MKIKNSVELWNEDVQPMRFVVDEIMPEGLNVIAGLPKCGKSWFALSLCIHVSKGEDFIGFKTLESEVLYLCLQDGERRLGKRVKALSNNPSENLFFVINVKSIGFGLEEEIVKFLEEHPKTKLIVIDSWQEIRSGRNNTSKYKSNYNELQALKEITEKYNICILLVHSTRKMNDKYPFNSIVGTKEFAGVVDNMYVLINEKGKNPKQMKLHINGREINDRVLYPDFKKYMNSSKKIMVLK